MRWVKKPLRLSLFSNQRIPVLIPSPTQYRNIFQTARCISYGHMQSKSLSWELHKGVFWDLSVWLDDWKARLWLGFFIPQEEEHRLSENTPQTVSDCIILTATVKVNSTVHKLPASLAGWWTCKCKQHARWTPQPVLCDTELKSCLACREH